MICRKFNRLNWISNRNKLKYKIINKIIMIQKILENQVNNNDIFQIKHKVNYCF